MSVRSIEAEVSIKSGVQAECSIGREVIVEVHDDVNLESLTVTTNGTYEPDTGIDGYDRVTVNVPPDIKASGSFVKTGGSGVTYTLDTGNTEWTHLLIRPHEFPHEGMAASAVSRAIMTKYIDLEIDAMITAYMSSAGTAYNAGSYKRISTGSECDVEDGVVRMTGESSTTGKWINDKQYDWWAW